MTVVCGCSAKVTKYRNGNVYFFVKFLVKYGLVHIVNRNEIFGFRVFRIQNKSIGWPNGKNKRFVPFVRRKYRKRKG